MIDLVTLNVGGYLYITFFIILTRYSDFMFGVMFGGDFFIVRDF